MSFLSVIQCYNAAGGVPPTTYYRGFPDSVEKQTSPVTVPTSSFNAVSSVDKSLFAKITIPAGSTLKRVWYYCGSGISAVATDVRVYNVNGTNLDSLLATGSFTPAASQWVRSGEVSGTVYFASDTDLFAGISVDACTGFLLTRTLGTENYYVCDVYQPSSGQALTLSNYYAGIAIEYTR